ncbi:MAG: TetR/AcrR family transcriptional regulator [Alphaproteobacteria bacterium]
MAQAALEFDEYENETQKPSLETVTNEAEINVTKEETQKANKGRPRSEKARKNILKATNTLLLHTSVQELSIESVAKKAKVGKTTIYRWWNSKTALVMDALISQPGLAAPLPTPKNNAEAIAMQLEKLIRMLDSKNGETIAQLFSEAQAGEEQRAIFNNNLLSPLVDALAFSLEQGIKEKEFRSSLDIKTAVDMLCGPIFFRLMAHPEDLGEDFQNSYPKEALRLISA